MAGTRDVLDALTGIAKTTLAGMSGLPPVQIASGWPPVTVLQDVGRSGSMVVAAYPRGTPRRSIRWVPDDVVATTVPPGVSATLSKPIVPVGGSATVTLSGTVVLNDGVGFIARAGRAETAIAVQAAAGETSLDLASRLGATIGVHPQLTAWFRRTVVGNVLTVTNRLPMAIALQVPVGNLTNAQQEVWRVLRPAALHLWAPNETLRHTVGDAFASALATSASAFGPTFADGTVGRLLYDGDDYVDADILLNIYRRDLHASIEYGVLSVDVLYPVLATALHYQTYTADSTLANITISPGV